MLTENSKINVVTSRGGYMNISELAELLKTTNRTIRYYEQELELQINRNEHGQRVYSEHDIELYKTILQMKDKGLTLKTIKFILQNKGLAAATTETEIIKSETQPISTEQLKAIIKPILEHIDEKNEALNVSLTKEIESLRNEIQTVKTDIIHENRQAAAKDRILIDSLKQALNKQESRYNNKWYRRLFNR